MKKVYLLCLIYAATLLTGTLPLPGMSAKPYGIFALCLLSIKIGISDSRRQKRFYKKYFLKPDLSTFIHTK